MNNTKQRRIHLYASRSIGETLSATFDFVTQNFVPLIKFLSAFLLPVSALMGLSYQSMFSSFAHIDNLNDETEQILSVVMSYLPVLLLSLIGALLTVAVTYTLMQKYQQRDNLLKGLTLSEIKPLLKHNLWRVLKMLLLLTLIGIVAFVVLVLVATMIMSIGSKFEAFLFLLYMAMLAIALPLGLVLPMCVFEPELGLFSCVKKALRLGFKTWGTLFVVMLVITMLVQIVSFILMIPFLFTTMTTMFFEIDSSQYASLAYTSSAWFSVLTFASSLLFCFGLLLMSALSFVAFAFCYGRAADKVEGVSVKNAVQNFDSTSSTEDTTADIISQFDKE
jgi:ABC-type sugar transport system permease subunit